MLDPNKWFYFAGGLYAKSIEELEQIIHHLSDEEFSFHVNGSKNDLANWVEGVFGEKDLADDLRRVMERKDTHTILQRFVKHFNYEHEVNVSKIEEPRPFKKESEQKTTFTEDEMQSSFAKNGLNLKEIETKEVLQIPEFNKGFSREDVEDSQDSIHESNSSELSDEELRDLAEDAKHDLEIEGRMVLQDKRLEELKKAHSEIDTSRKFIVKEFIYGFLMGLVFGFILLGVLLQVNICY